MHVRVPLRSVLISMFICMYVRTYVHMCLKSRDRSTVGKTGYVAAIHSIYVKKFLCGGIIY